MNGWLSFFFICHYCFATIWCADVLRYSTVFNCTKKKYDTQNLRFSSISEMKKNTRDLKHVSILEIQFEKNLDNLYSFPLGFSMQLYQCRCELLWSWCIPSSRPVLAGKPWYFSGSCKHYRYLLCTDSSGLTYRSKNTIKTMQHYATHKLIHE